MYIINWKIIYIFGRRFYPKQLTLPSKYNSLYIFPGNLSYNLIVNDMPYHNNILRLKLSSASHSETHSLTYIKACNNYNIYATFDFNVLVSVGININ